MRRRVAVGRDGSGACVPDRLLGEPRRQRTGGKVRGCGRPVRRLFPPGSPAQVTPGFGPCVAAGVRAGALGVPVGVAAVGGRPGVRSVGVPLPGAAPGVVPGTGRSGRGRHGRYGRCGRCGRRGRRSGRGRRGRRPASRLRNGGLGRRGCRWRRHTLRGPPIVWCPRAGPFGAGRRQRVDGAGAGLAVRRTAHHVAHGTARRAVRRARAHRSGGRGEAVVQGVDGGRGPRVLGGVVVQLPPPVVLATGGPSPLLAHAANCPPHGPYENGASGKCAAPRVSNDFARDAREPAAAVPGETRRWPPGGSTPHGRTARRLG